MTLCLLNYEYPPIGAGAASATQAIADSLTRQGLRVVVVTAGFGDLVGERMEGGVHTIRLRCRRQRADRASLPEMLSFVATAWKRLPAIVRSIECSGIICFFTVPCGPAAWHAWRKTGIPYVISLRGGDVPGLVPSIDWIHRSLAPFRRAILRDAVAVIANSEALQQLSRASDPVPVDFIPNGVDTEKFYPAIATREDGVFRVLAVGRLQEQKNNAFALRALAAIRPRIAQRLEYHIAGDGPLRSDLQKLAQQLGLAEQVFWHGWIPREKLREEYRSCDCLLHPTLYEGMPNAVLEAMASGLPVIASDVPGNAHLVREGQTGYICALGDEAAFSNALTKLANDIQLRGRLGRAARRIVEIEYSWDIVAKQYRDMFRRPYDGSHHG
jgi:glycosyltransferase involved in cell wall biosynthesis